MRKPTLIALLIALVVAIVAGPAQAAKKGCDLTGDKHRANDCIAHSHVGATADGNMRPGDTITIRQHIADALRGSALVVEVQMRRVSRDGTKGPWVGLRRTRWSAADTAAHSARTVDICRAGVAGRYEFRTATHVPRTALTGRALRRASSQTATSAPTAVTLPNRALSGACPSSPDDESIIEYFNEIEFSMGFSVQIVDQGTSFSILLSCPPPENPSFPPPTFGFAVALEGAPSGIGCNAGAIILNKATMMGGGYRGCTFSVCTFDFVAYNEQTQVVYSDTFAPITFTSGNNTYFPNLNPATLPICPANFQPCVLTGTCTLTPPKGGAITLCANGTTCTVPSSNNPYSYNANVYFQAAINSQT